MKRNDKNSYISERFIRRNEDQQKYFGVEA